MFQHNNTVKRKKQGILISWVMWRALAISLVVHLGVIFLIPSVQILPPGDAEYIEVERVWVEESAGVAQDEGIGEEPVESPENIPPEPPQAEAPIPTNLEAVEPEMVEDSSHTAEDEAAPDPLTSEEPPQLARMNQFQSPIAPPDILPGEAADDIVPEIPKKIPESETMEAAPIKPESQPVPDVLPSPVSQDEAVSPEISDDEPRMPEIPAFVVSEIVEEGAQDIHLFSRLQPSAPQTAALAPAELEPLLKETRESVLVPSADMPESPQKPEADMLAGIEELLPAVEATAPETQQPEELPAIEIPERTLLAGASQQPEELSIASYSRHSPAPQQSENAPRPFAQSSNTKIAPISMPSLTDENLIHREEPAIQFPLPQQEPVNEKPLVQQALDEPRALQTVQDIFMNMSSQSAISPSPRPPQLPDVKRSFVIGGKTEEQVLAPDRSAIGIVVRKEPVLPQNENQDAVLEPEDIERTSPDVNRGASASAVEGPAAHRKVLYKPRQFPEIQLDTEVNIRLKFWVLPDGSVGEVLPLQRGDIRLERAAIEYLRSWRFTPVAPNQPRVWGIIPITYKLQ